MDLKTKAKDQKISITMTSLQVEPMSRKERRCTDKERLGSNPLTCLMDHASVKMRNLEASLFKPNSPNRENLFRTLCTPQELIRAHSGSLDP